MASGTSRNGSHSPGANQEPIKQDLPKKETQRSNPIYPTTSIFKFNPLRLISRFRSSSTSAAEMNRSSLLPLTSPRLPISSTRPLSSPLPISSPWPLSNNQNSPISSFQDLQEAVLITNNQKLPDSIRIYFTASDQLPDIFPGLKESVKAVLEGWTSTSCRNTLAASTASLEEVVNKVKALHQNQLNMWKKQEFDGKILDAELGGIGLCKDIYHTIFTSLAAFFGAGAFFAFRVHPVSVAVTVAVFAAGASVMSIAVGKRIDSHQDELKIPVNKRKEITEAMSGAAKLALEQLDDIMESASFLKSHTESMLEMVDSGAVESSVIVTGIEALKQGFQQLETKIDRCSKNADSSRQAVVNSIIKNLD